MALSAKLSTFRGKVRYFESTLIAVTFAQEIVSRFYHQHQHFVGKKKDDIKSYFGFMSKLFLELKPIVETKKLIPDHQFRFRKNFLWWNAKKNFYFEKSFFAYNFHTNFSRRNILRDYIWKIIFFWEIAFRSKCP